MNLQIIKSEEEYETLLQWVDNQFDLHPDPESNSGQQLQIALLLIKQYEDEHYAIPAPDPIAVVKLKMEEQGFKNKDLAGWIGRIAKLLHQKLGIPAAVFFI